MTASRKVDNLPYDPLNHETWPEEQKEFAGRVWEGLLDGNLIPLAQYLRAGHYIDRALANDIANAIEGKEVGYFRIVPKGYEPGQRGFTKTIEDYDRKMTIGVFMESRLREYGRGGYDSALDETKKKFGIKSGATVAKALKHLRDHMDRAECAPGWDQWEHLKRFYSTP